jgi:hypothetical protein
LIEKLIKCIKRTSLLRKYEIFFWKIFFSPIFRTFRIFTTYFHLQAKKFIPQYTSDSPACFCAKIRKKQNTSFFFSNFEMYTYVLRKIEKKFGFKFFFFKRWKPLDSPLDNLHFVKISLKNIYNCQSHTKNRKIFWFDRFSCFPWFYEPYIPLRGPIQKI